MRQFFEAGANAAYGLANPNHDDYIVKEKDGTISVPDNLVSKRYKWLAEHFPAGSNPIKQQKKAINDSCAHSNMVYVFNNFEMNAAEGTFNMSYFDKEDDYMVKTNLWFVANSTMGLVDLFYGVNKKYPRIKFINDFPARLKELEKENLRLKKVSSNHPRFIAARERSETTNN